MALIDAAVTAQDAKIVAQVLSLGARNGGISRFGNLQTDVIPMPTMRSSKVRCPDGVTRTRGERLDNLVEVPYDDRGTEVASALAIAAIVGFCGTVNVLGLDHFFCAPLESDAGVSSITFDFLKHSVLFGLREEDNEVSSTNLPPLKIDSGPTELACVENILENVF